MLWVWVLVIAWRRAAMSIFIKASFACFYSVFLAQLKTDDVMAQVIAFHGSIQHVIVVVFTCHSGCFTIAFDYWSTKFFTIKCAWLQLIVPKSYSCLHWLFVVKIGLAICWVYRFVCASRTESRWVFCKGRRLVTISRCFGKQVSIALVSEHHLICMAGLVQKFVLRVACHDEFKAFRTSCCLVSYFRIILTQIQLLFSLFYVHVDLSHIRW